MDLPKSKNVTASFEAGDIIADSYEVVRPIYGSSSGQYYLCSHLEHNDTLVVMKILGMETVDADLARHFRTEIAALYSVDHPNVVECYEYINKNGLLAYTMEYVAGGNLSTLINPIKPLEIELIAEVLAQMISGLAAIHQAGILHRDLKPENILLDENMQVKISNFSISREMMPSEKGGSFVGTVEYLSPEYLQDGIVAQSCDIYAFGVISYQLLTGRLPFEGSNSFETMKLKSTHNPTPPHKIRSSVPVELSDLVMKAIARHPAERYQSAKEILADLKSVHLGTKPTEVNETEQTTQRAATERQVLGEKSVLADAKTQRTAPTREAGTSAVSAKVSPQEVKRPSMSGELNGTSQLPFKKSPSSSRLGSLRSRINPDQAEQYYGKTAIMAVRKRAGIRKASLLVVVAMVIAVGVFIAGRLYANSKPSTDLPSLQTTTAKPIPKKQARSI